MRNYRLLALAVTLATLTSLYPAVVMARPVAPTANDLSLYVRAVGIARAAWPESPCAGLERVSWDTDPAILGIQEDGLAYSDGSCRVVMRTNIGDTTDAYYFCSLLAHEFGHLAGQMHTVGGVMDGSGHPDYGPCAGAIPSINVQVRMVLRRLGQPRARCTYRRGRVHCVTRTWTAYGTYGPGPHGPIQLADFVGQFR